LDLEFLRELQGQSEPPMSFGEYRVEKSLNPGLGYYGGPLNTSSQVPNVPRNIRSGMGGTGVKDTDPWFGQTGYRFFQGDTSSQYSPDRVPSQPPPWISDVDMSNVWYSPFQPIWPYGPPSITYPVEWNYPVGYNLNYIQPRMELMGTLRAMRSSWGPLATVIETRKDQLLRLPWTIQRRDKPKASSKTVDELRRFFRRPDGQMSFGRWARKLMDDLFVCDAPTIYFDRSLTGQLRRAEVLDGAMIFPLIDDAGRRPQSEYKLDENGLVYYSRQPAFQQVRYGLPMVNLSEDQILQAIMRPRPNMPMFGYSPVEQIMMEATEAIRKTFYQGEFWRAGSMPELIVTVPDNWTPRQIVQFQGQFDALLSGQLTLKSKVRFVPGGMKPFDIKNASGQSLWSERDEFLARLVCFAFSIPPTPFVKQTNRGTAQNAQQTAQEEGLYPLMSWWKDDVMDYIIQDVLGYDDIEAVFLPRPEVDLLKQAQIHEIRLKMGDMSINEVREESNLEPIAGGDEHLVYFGSAAVKLSSILDGTAMLPGAPQPAGGQGSSTPKPSAEPPKAQPQRGPARPTGAGTLPPVSKATKEELDSAADNAKGHLDDMSHLQLHSGNYPKGHIWIQGLNISIENNTGSKRGEKDQHGTKYEVTMPSPYGYIRGTIGADGDQVDCYLGPNPESSTVWVIDQNRVSKKGKIKNFDEHKVLIGYDDLKTGLKDYLESHFDGHGHDRVDKVVELSMADFKSWLKDGDQKAPIADQNVGKLVLKHKDLKKSDTISVASNYSSYGGFTKPKKSRKRRRAKSGPRWLTLAA
jgi:hypothetical protein